MDETIKTYDLDDVEIFEAGTWNGDKYTESDIDDIVASFTEIGAKLKPYVKLGHKAQDLLAKDGLPSAGWITGLKRVGNKLVASIKNVPEKVYQLIQAKAYGRVSSEIFWNLKDGGKTYRRALKAVALLGAETPAVTSLDDFINLYTENDYDKLALCSYKEDSIMEIDVKKYEMEIDGLNTKLKEYELQLSDKDKQLSEASDKIKQFEAEKTAAFTREVESYLDGAVKEGKISPAQKDIMAGLTSVESFEKIKEFVSAQGAQIPMGEQSEHQEVDRTEMSDDEKLDSAVKAYAKEHNVSYREAFTAVANEGGN